MTVAYEVQTTTVSSLIFLLSAFLHPPLTNNAFAISLPYVYTEPLTHLDQEPFSPQFMGCVREDYTMGLTEDGYLLDISMENNNEDCIVSQS